MFSFNNARKSKLNKIQSSNSQFQEYAEEITRKQSLTHASASARTLDGEVCGENLAYAGGMFTSGEEGNFTKKWPDC